MFFGLTGFAATNGSKASSSVQFPGRLTKLSSQVPTALGRESSISGPRVAADAGIAIQPASVMPARPMQNFFSAARRVTDCAKPLVSSSNWVFIVFLSVLVLLFVSLCRENPRVTCGIAFAHLLIHRKKMAVTLS